MVTLIAMSPAKSLAMLDSRAQGIFCSRNAAACKGVHGDLEAHALLAQPVRGGHAHVVEMHLGRGRATDTQLVERLAEREARHTLLDHEVGDAFVSGPGVG